jgi:hypothetical protein
MKSSITQIGCYAAAGCMPVRRHCIKRSPPISEFILASTFSGASIPQNIRNQSTLRKPALHNFAAKFNTSNFQRSKMTSSKVVARSNVNIEEEIKITVGDVEYLLILNQEVAAVSDFLCYADLL